MEQTVKLNIETVNSVLNYLSNQPFKEVVSLINGIQKDAKELKEEVK